MPSNSGCITCGATLRGDGKCEASGMTPAVCGKRPFHVGGDQPAACQVLLSEDGNGYDAATCNTCGTVIGPWPQPQHSRAERAEAERDALRADLADADAKRLALHTAIVERNQVVARLEAERDRYRAALADARRIATTGVWDCDPARCYGDQIVGTIEDLISTALNGGDDE